MAHEISSIPLHYHSKSVIPHRVAVGVDEVAEGFAAGSTIVEGQEDALGVFRRGRFDNAVEIALDV